MHSSSFHRLLCCHAYVRLYFLSPSAPAMHFVQLALSTDCNLQFMLQCLFISFFLFVEAWPGRHDRPACNSLTVTSLPSWPCYKQPKQLKPNETAFLFPSYTLPYSMENIDSLMCSNCQILFWLYIFSQHDSNCSNPVLPGGQRQIRPFHG